jgi:short subunit dehydrogenase-like uncharacterized protein
MSREFDIIILGATGYTGQYESARRKPRCSPYVGRLITRYLEKHPERSKIKYAIAGRSVNKLNDLTKELKLDQSNVTIIGVNISDFDELEALVKRTRLVINCVGPFALYSTPVVQFVHATSWVAPLTFPIAVHVRGLQLTTRTSLEKRTGSSK